MPAKWIEEIDELIKKWGKELSPEDYREALEQMANRAECALIAFDEEDGEKS